MGFFNKLKETFFKKSNQEDYLSGFKKTNEAFSMGAQDLAERFEGIDENFLEELMVLLLQSDIGFETAENIIKELEAYNKEYPIYSFNAVMEFVLASMQEIYGTDAYDFSFLDDEGPQVILLVGVNGSGKTTSAAKLVKKYQDEGKSVAVVAADTFRAGAIDQLARWADRLNVPCIKGVEGGDPSAAIVDGCRYAKKNDIDILICDTAGRLQNKLNLMAELNKMHRVIEREIKGAPQAVWLVIDATTGQNGISQASIFLEAANVDGVILSKMDGTSKGGIVIAIKEQLDIPVVYVGVGEKPEDLQEFDIDSYLYSIAQGLDNAEK